jgi:hypothetical protein
MNIEKSKATSLYAIFLGALLITISFTLYRLFQPLVITEEISILLQRVSIIFYALLFGGIAWIAYGINAGIRSFPAKADIDRSDFYTNSLSKIIVSIINDSKYFRFFWPVTIGYGIFYAAVSGMLIYRTEDFSSLYGVTTTPSINIITYGPTGFVPTMTVYINQHFGMLIIPLNLLVAVAVASLVGFNFVLSFYAFINRPRNHVRTKNAKTISFLSIIGATTSLFAGCPTCASLYIFSIAGGSLAPTIAAFTVNFYTLFLFLSIPLLIFTPFLTAFNIRKTVYGRCSLG